MAATTSRMPEQYQPLQEEEVDDVPFTPLKALQNVGVQQADIKKLSEAGFATVEQILMTSKRKLTDVKGLSEAKVAKIGDAANKVCPNKLAFKSGLERQNTSSTRASRSARGRASSASPRCCSTPSRARPRRRSRSHPAASTTPRTEGGPPPPASHKDTLTSSLTAWIQIKD